MLGMALGPGTELRKQVVHNLVEFKRQALLLCGPVGGGCDGQIRGGQSPGMFRRWSLGIG